MLPGLNSAAHHPTRPMRFKELSCAGLVFALLTGAVLATLAFG